jgi:hypothetical protein
MPRALYTESRSAWYLLAMFAMSERRKATCKTTPTGRYAIDLR